MRLQVVRGVATFFCTEFLCYEPKAPSVSEWPHAVKRSFSMTFIVPDDAPI